MHPVRWFGERPRTTDAVLAGLIAVMSLVTHFVVRNADGGALAQPSVVTVVLCLTATVPIAWRRRSPAAVLLTVTVAQGMLEVMNAAGPGWMGVLIASYSLGAYHDRRKMRWVAVAFIGSVTVFVVGAALHGEAPWPSVLRTLILLPAAIVLGENVALRRHRLADLMERTERAERERELVTNQHVQEERTRIARELHDVVAHSVTVMVIQAGAARRQLGTNPTQLNVVQANVVQANVALESIEATGRSAMVEMRRILGVLRQDDDPTVLSPTPSLGQLDTLVRADPDLVVQLSTDGRMDDVPSGVEVNIYRLVQEALTNVRRHGGRVDKVVVSVARRGDNIDVVVHDDGRGASTLSTATLHAATFNAAGTVRQGHGLIGMRERVAASGGTFSAGPCTGGGWRVHAVFPVGTS